MGREIRRVPLDFAWPLNKVWPGFLNPHHRPCPEDGKNCHGGYTSAAKWLDSIVRLICLIGEEAIQESHAAELHARGRSYPHPHLTEWAQAPRVHRENQLISFGGEELAEVVRELAGGRELGLFGSNPGYHIRQTLLKAAGIEDPENWGTCQICNGHAIDPAILEAYEAWREESPPAGEAWQLWETTSDGSPISPPKPTPESLAHWLADTGASSFGSFTESYETWLRFIQGPE